MTLVSIICKGKEFGMPPPKLYPMISLSVLQGVSLEWGELSKMTTISSEIHYLGLYDKVAQWQPAWSFAESHLKDEHPSIYTFF